MSLMFVADTSGTTVGRGRLDQASRVWTLPARRSRPDAASRRSSVRRRLGPGRPDAVAWMVEAANVACLGDQRRVAVKNPTPRSAWNAATTAPSSMPGRPPPARHRIVDPLQRWSELHRASPETQIFGRRARVLRGPVPPQTAFLSRSHSVQAAPCRSKSRSTCWRYGGSLRLPWLGSAPNLHRFTVSSGTQTRSAHQHGAGEPAIAHPVDRSSPDRPAGVESTRVPRRRTGPSDSIDHIVHIPSARLHNRSATSRSAPRVCVLVCDGVRRGVISQGTDIPFPAALCDRNPAFRFCGIDISENAAHFLYGCLAASRIGPANPGNPPLNPALWDEAT